MKEIQCPTCNGQGWEQLHKLSTTRGVYVEEVRCTTCLGRKVIDVIDDICIDRKGVAV